MIKEAIILSPLARQTARDTSPIFRGGVRSLMQSATVRAPVSTERRLMRLAICTNGDECGAIAEDIQHQLIDFKPGTEECLIDALPVVMRDWRSDASAYFCYSKGFWKLGTNCADLSILFGVKMKVSWC